MRACPTRACSARAGVDAYIVDQLLSPYSVVHLRFGSLTLILVLKENERQEEEFTTMKKKKRHLCLNRVEEARMTTLEGRHTLIGQIAKAEGGQMGMRAVVA
jgi:hypothetical protein